MSKLTNLYKHVSKSKIDQRLFTILIIAFRGFMRFSKTVGNMSFQHKFSTSVQKTFLWRKALIGKEGGFMFQSLVTQLKILFEAIRLSDNLDEEYIFRAASKNRKCCVPISFIRTRQALTDALKAAVLTQRNFESLTLHSGRAIVVANSEVSGRLFERHGS